MKRKQQLQLCLSGFEASFEKLFGECHWAGHCQNYSLLIVWLEEKDPVKLGCSCWQSSALRPSQAATAFVQTRTNGCIFQWVHQLCALRVFLVYEIKACALLGHLVGTEHRNTGPNPGGCKFVNTFLQSLRGNAPDPVVQHPCPNTPSLGAQWCEIVWRCLERNIELLYVVLLHLYVDIRALACMGLDFRLHHPWR